MLIIFVTNHKFLENSENPMKKRKAQIATPNKIKQKIRMSDSSILTNSGLLKHNHPKKITGAKPTIITKSSYLIVLGMSILKEVYYLLLKDQVNKYENTSPS